MMFRIFNTISKHVNIFKMRGQMLKNMKVNMNKKTVDWNLEHRVDNIVCPPEVFNANDFSKIFIPLVERGGADPFHDKGG
jgi:hypothetical protein